MTSTDPIADMLSRIRNAIAVRKSEVSLPHSAIKESVARLLQSSNFIDDVRVVDARVGKTLVLSLFPADASARITEITRVSKPGRRYYVRAQEIPTVKRGRGMVIISTSKGLMSGEQARTERIGGELICRVY